MKIIILFLSTFILFLSCKKEESVPGPAGPQGPAGLPGDGGPADTGTISGHVMLYDEFSFKKIDNSGIVVTLASGSQQFAFTTGPGGEYEFTGVKTGTYHILYEKTGYGTMKLFGLSHIGGGNAPTAIKDIYLLQIPVKTAIDSIASGGNSIYSAVVSITLDTSSMQYVQYEQNFLVFVGKDEHVGPSDYVNTYNSILPDGNGAYTVAIPKPDISDSFQAGDTLYITAFTYNRYVHLGPNPTYYADPGDGGFYIDPDTGLYVFPNQRISPNILKVIY